MPATISDLKNAFASDPAFALEAAERGLELVEAKAEYADKIASQLKVREEELQSKLVELEAALASKDQELLEAADRARVARGTKPASEAIVVNFTPASAADQVRDRVNELSYLGMTRARAHAHVMRNDSELRDRYIAEHQVRRFSK